MKRSKEPLSEQSVSDGLRHLGHLVASNGGYDCFDADDHHLGRVSTVAEARQAIIRAGKASAA